MNSKNGGKGGILIFPSFFKPGPRKWMSAIIALIFLFNSCFPAWAQREGNTGDSGAWESFGMGALAGAVTSVAAYVAPEATAAGSIASDLVGLALYYTNYSTQGEAMVKFKIGGTEIAISKGQFWSMVAGIVASAAAGGVTGAIKGAAKGVAEAAVKETLKKAAEETAKTTLKQMVAQAISTATQTVVEAAKAIGRAALWVVQNGRGAVTEAVRAVGRAAVWAGDALVSGARKLGEYLSMIAQDIKSLPDRLYDKFANLKTKITSFFKSPRAFIRGGVKGLEESAQNNPYYYYGTQGQYGKAVVHLGGDLISGFAELLARRTGEEILKEKFGWDKTEAEIFAGVVGSYARTFVSVMLNNIIATAMGGALANNGAIVTDEDTQRLIAASEFGEQEVVIQDSSGNEIGRMKLKELAQGQILGRNEAGKIVNAGKDEISEVITDQQGKAMGARLTNGEKISLQTQDAVSLNAGVQNKIQNYFNLLNSPLLKMTGGPMMDVQGNILSDINPFSAGLKAMQNLGLAPIASAGVRVAVLKALGYQSYYGRDSGRIFENLWKTALASSAGNFTASLVNNLDALNSWYAGTGYAEEQRGKENFKIYNNPWKTRGEMNLGNFALTELAKEAGSAASSILWGYVSKGAGIETPYVAGLLHLAGSSLTSGLIDAVLRRDPAKAIESKNVLYPVDKDGKINTEAKPKTEDELINQEGRAKKEGSLYREENTAYQPQTMSELRESYNENQYIYQPVDSEGDGRVDYLVVHKPDGTDAHYFRPEDENKIKFSGLGSEGQSAIYQVVEQEEYVPTSQRDPYLDGRLNFSPTYSESDTSLPQAMGQLEERYAKAQYIYQTIDSQGLGQDDYLAVFKPDGTDAHLFKIKSAGENIRESLGRFGRSVVEDFNNNLTQAFIDAAPLPYPYRSSGTGLNAIQAQWQTQAKFGQHIEAIMQGLSPYQAAANLLASNMNSWAAENFGNSLAYGLGNHLWLPEKFQSYAAFIPSFGVIARERELKEKELKRLEDLKSVDETDLPERLSSLEGEKQGLKIEKQGWEEKRAAELAKEEKNQTSLPEARAELSQINARIENLTQQINEKDTAINQKMKLANYALRQKAQGQADIKNLRDLKPDEVWKLVKEGLPEAKQKIAQEIDNLSSQIANLKSLEGVTSITGLLPVAGVLPQVITQASAAMAEKGNFDLPDIIKAGVIDYSLDRRIQKSPVDIKEVSRPLERYVESPQSQVRPEDKEAAQKALEVGQSERVRSVYSPSVAGAPQAQEVYGQAVVIGAQTSGLNQAIARLKQEVKPEDKEELLKAAPWLSDKENKAERQEEALENFRKLGPGVVIFSPELSLLERTTVDRFGRKLETNYYNQEYDSATQGWQPVKQDLTTTHYYGPFGYAGSVTKDYTEITLPAEWLAPAKKAEQEKAPAEKKASPPSEDLKVKQPQVKQPKAKQPGSLDLESMSAHREDPAEALRGLIKDIEESKTQQIAQPEATQQESPYLKKMFCEGSVCESVYHHKKPPEPLDLKLMSAHKLAEESEPKAKQSAKEYYINIPRKIPPANDGAVPEAPSHLGASFGPNINYRVNIYSTGEGESPYTGPAYQIAAQDINSGTRLKPELYYRVPANVISEEARKLEQAYIAQKLTAEQDKKYQEEFRVINEDYNQKKNEIEKAGKLAGKSDKEIIEQTEALNKETNKQVKSLRDRLGIENISQEFQESPQAASLKPFQEKTAEGKIVYEKADKALEGDLKAPFSHLETLQFLEYKRIPGKEAQLELFMPVWSSIVGYGPRDSLRLRESDNYIYGADALNAALVKTKLDADKKGNPGYSEFLAGVRQYRLDSSTALVKEYPQLEFLSALYQYNLDVAVPEKYQGLSLFRDGLISRANIGAEPVVAVADLVRAGINLVGETSNLPVMSNQEPSQVTGPDSINPAPGVITENILPPEEPPKINKSVSLDTGSQASQKLSQAIPNPDPSEQEAADLSDEFITQMRNRALNNAMRNSRGAF